MGVLALDCIRKKFSGFSGFCRFKGVGAKKSEAPQSINNGDARRSADKQVSRLGFPDIDRLTANDKDFSLTLEMTIRESPSLLFTSH